ncbi:hypothetical protein [Pedobacter sp. Leaf250]|uniref:hypothetical protein n=1 Tax=Pedobacter sp. Leaf250 TaxID=2876559 RepID=UPI00120C758F|nr:hypothetical protein [Pedobacter sp. Leaf250]RZJ90910.1 MAG: hypothetical protein EOO20_06740 [Chryseobacterium sp.]
MKENIFPPAFSSAFSAGLDFFRKQFKKTATRYPRGIIVGMVLLMGISAALSFTLMRADKPYTSLSAKVAQYPGMLPQTSPNLLLEVITLQAELKSFADKGEPNPTDSLRMEEILKRIQQLNQKLINK